MKGKKPVRGKWNFLIMRPKGEVTNFAVSPLLLAVAIVFALAFSVGAILVFNLYLNLYLDHLELTADQQETLTRLNQLDYQYKYQRSLTQDYADLLGDLDLPKPEPREGGDAPETAPPLSPEEEKDPLSFWAARLPAEAAKRAEENLRVVDFKVEGNRFSFQLLNEASGNLARGRILLLFLVEAGGRRQAVPFPEFDHRSPQPDFEVGPGYNIRSSKYISGQLQTPADSEILAMMVAAQASDGRMVMKKLVKP